MSGGEYEPSENIQFPNRSGYMFDGWYTTPANQTTEWSGYIDSEVLQTVYAKWLPFSEWDVMFNGMKIVIMDRNL